MIFIKKVLTNEKGVDIITKLPRESSKPRSKMTEPEKNQETLKKVLDMQEIA